MDKYRETPIFKKSEEIFQTVKSITDLFPEDNKSLQQEKTHLLRDAMLVRSKLAGAFAVKLYDLKMGNATIIRKAARDLMVSYHNLKIYGFQEHEYYQIVRGLIEEFRLLFIEWIAGFDPKHYIVDSWGLFNPSGISPDYEQPDDELDFLNNDDEDDC